MKSYVYRDKSGQWRITLIARNGRIVMDGGEGYTSQRNAVAAAHRLSRPAVARAFTAPIVVAEWPLPKRAAVAKKVAA